MRILFIISLLCTLGCKNHIDQGITVATASNMHFAMNQLSRTYILKTNVLCNVVTGSSGKLVAQIENGAPFHVFVGADTIYPDRLYKAGKTLGKPQSYAIGSISIWSRDSLVSIEDLASAKVERIAIPNPKTAPYGRAAVEALKYYKLYDKIIDKLVYGESVAQTAQYIESGAVTTGIIATAFTRAQPNRGETAAAFYTLPIAPQSHTPIIQRAVAIKSGNDDQERRAQEFIAFLQTDEMSRILNTFGYRRPNPVP